MSYMQDNPDLPNRPLTHAEQEEYDDYCNRDFRLDCLNCDRSVSVSRHEWEIGDAPSGCEGFDGRGCHR